MKATDVIGLLSGHVRKMKMLSAVIGMPSAMFAIPPEDSYTVSPCRETVHDHPGAFPSAVSRPKYFPGPSRRSALRCTPFPPFLGTLRRSASTDG